MHCSAGLKGPNCDSPGQKKPLQLLAVLEKKAVRVLTCLMSSFSGDKQWNANCGNALCGLARDVLQRTYSCALQGRGDRCRVRWAVMHDRPVLWACDPSNWLLDLISRPLPTQSTISKQLQQSTFEQLLNRHRKSTVITHTDSCAMDSCYRCQTAAGRRTQQRRQRDLGRW